MEPASEEFVEHGYDSFTIDAVAVRAHTTRAVLYRRWPTKPDLVKAAIVEMIDDIFLPLVAIS